jgi:tRNA-splicing ligase RtcB
MSQAFEDFLIHKANGQIDFWYRDAKSKLKMNHEDLSRDNVRKTYSMIIQGFSEKMNTTLEKIDLLEKIVKGTILNQKEIELERINCHHNFTQRELHQGEELWITRKGAIQMKLGQKGVIPGSMGTNSYIVSGLENADAFHSAPHGAGRRMSRSKAKQTFNLEDLKNAMYGIEFKLSDAFIDEIPGAYKDVEKVITQSKDLIVVEEELHQILNVKGN